MENVALVIVGVIFGGSIWGIFKTKKPGFGLYNTSVLILCLVLFVAAISAVMGRVNWESLANLLFAVAGYVGGLLTAAIEKEER